MPDSSVPSQDQRRTARTNAVKIFNELASAANLTRIAARPPAEAATTLWVSLWKAVPPESRDQLLAAKNSWVENGGAGEFPEAPLPGDEGAADPEDTHVTSEIVDNHRVLQQTFYPAPAKKAFRLHSKAFLLTFNSIAFTASIELWGEFTAWIKERVSKYKANYWSAAMEKSSHAETHGRVHVHVYFSWQTAGSNGVDHSTTDAWVFRSCRPRVDVNSETRGPYFWLKACQHGHFYCSVFKEGALYTDTNYPPWQGQWVPEAAWVVSLWKQHKLGHDAFLRLSAKLRDGHDRRKAAVAAVRESESAFEFDAERAWARQQILAKARPFKPLPWGIENWKMGYEEVEERYRMLVLYGPSQTGKSRLARSLFGTERTLVVDVQHAEHPDMHAYRRHSHLAVLLDEVADPSFIVNNKKLLQAHVDGAILGQSATQKFTYEVFLWRTPIILTTNNWNLSHLCAEDLDWIHANCVAVHVPEPVYQSSNALPAPRAPSQRRRPVGAMTPQPSPEHKRFATTSICPGCGDPMPCRCR